MERAKRHVPRGHYIKGVEPDHTAFDPGACHDPAGVGGELGIERVPSPINGRGRGHF